MCLTAGVVCLQVIEFYANGTAIEEYKPRTPQQLGLHPRDVVLFAPLSRLAAPQVRTGFRVVSGFGFGIRAYVHGGFVWAAQKSGSVRTSSQAR